MRTTVVLPDPLFRRVKATAALEGKNLRTFITEALVHELEGSAGREGRKRVRLPLVPSKHPGSLKITGQTVANVLAGEDTHVSP